MSRADVRSAKLVDLPVVRRLVEKGVLLDSEMCYTREADGSRTAALQSIMLPQRGLHTLVGRVKRRHVIGQFRMKGADSLAQIVCIAPRLTDHADDTAWLAVLDAMTYEAGKRGAHMLTGEVDELSPLFVLMRRAGFAVYARQQAWHLPAISDEFRAMLVQSYSVNLHGTLSEETDDDTLDIQLLYSNIVPRLVQPIVVPSRDSRGLVYRSFEGKIQAYVAVVEGKSGIYLMPFMHPDALGHEAASIIAAVIAQLHRADRLPIVVCVRRYQDWLEESLETLGFERGAQQAVMVRHVTAGVRTMKAASAFVHFASYAEVVASPFSRPSFEAQTGDSPLPNGTTYYRRFTGTETGTAAEYHRQTGRDRQF
jgi:hypothetical protein